MLHVLPASGTPNHGLVSYNPKFFWMLGRSNGYKIAFMTMGQSDRDAGLPDDLVEFLALYEPQAKSQFAAYTMPVTSIVVALQKVFDTPFVGAARCADRHHDRALELARALLVGAQAGPFVSSARTRAARTDQGGLQPRTGFGREGCRYRATQARRLRTRTVCRGARMDRAYARCADRAMHKLRRWLHARAPRWLIAAKRKMFGAAGAKSDGTRSGGT